MADNYPEELRVKAEAALLLTSLKHSVFDDNTIRTLQRMKDQYLGRINKGGENPVAENEAVPVTENPTGNLPPAVLPQFELPIPAWNPPEFPPVTRLTGLIGNCSKPFEKQLTDSDVIDDQSRLSINKADVENYILPLLNTQEENLENGIPVTVYDSAGEEYKMIFKNWGSKISLLSGEWKKFCHHHNLRKLQDFVTLWMFRHVQTEKLCFVITSRRLPVDILNSRRRTI